MYKNPDKLYNNLVKLNKLKKVDNNMRLCPEDVKCIKEITCSHLCDEYNKDEFDTSEKIVLKKKSAKEDNMTVFSIRIDKELLKKYDDLSALSDYSRNELINKAMEYYIERVKFEEE